MANGSEHELLQELERLRADNKTLLAMVEVALELLTVPDHSQDEAWQSAYETLLGMRSALREQETK